MKPALYRAWLAPRTTQKRSRNWILLWSALTALLILTTALLLWLVDLYQNAQEQRRTESAVQDMGEWATKSLMINLQEMQSVAGAGPAWTDSALQVLRSTKYLYRIERRDTSFSLVDAIDSPSGPPLFGHMPRYRSQKEVLQACAAAKEPGIPIYSPSYFVPTGKGIGVEVLDLCVAEQAIGGGQGGQVTGFTVATIGLGKLLEVALPEALSKSYEATFLQSDDTRLARAGISRGVLEVPRGPPKFRAEKLLAVPGLTLRLRLESLRGAPPIQFNLVTAAGGLLSLLLLTVLCLLLREVKRRADGAAVIRHQQERLQAAARLATVGEIASLISHEINQPLHSIAMYADAAAHIAKEHPNMPAEMLELLYRISDQAVRGGRVVRGVRDFVSRGQVVRETVSAAALISGVLPLIELQSKDIGGTVVVDAGPPTLKVVCDRLMVEQLLLNLARNAIQAMSSNASARSRELHISANRTDSGWVRFEIRDTGPGIAPDVLERLSQPLYKPFESTKGDGMGLGLSMCKSIAEAHLGVLEFSNIRSETPDHPIAGACFTFTLPGKVASSKRGHTFDGDTVPQLT